MVLLRMGFWGVENDPARVTDTGMEDQEPGAGRSATLGAKRGFITGC